MNIIVNNFNDMSNLKLDTIRILGFSLVKKEDLKCRLVSNSRSSTINILNVNMNEHGEIKLSNLNLNMNEEFEINFESAQVTENIFIDDERLRTDCFPEPDSNEFKCLNRKCRWIPSQISNVPWCFIDKKRLIFI